MANKKKDKFFDKKGVKIVPMSKNMDGGNVANKSSKMPMSTKMPEKLKAMSKGNGAKPAMKKKGKK